MVWFFSEKCHAKLVVVLCGAFSKPVNSVRDCQQIAIANHPDAQNRKSAGAGTDKMPSLLIDVKS